MNMNTLIFLLCMVYSSTINQHNVNILEKFEHKFGEEFTLETSGRRDLFIDIGGDEECQRWDTWTVSGSGSLNHMAEATPPHMFGIKVDDSTNGATTCDLLLGVFTLAGSFGCVIEGGAPANTITYCSSYPDMPVYAFNHNVRRWGTFVAMEQGCTDQLKVNRFYMKNSSVEKYWTYNEWVGKTEDNEVKYSVFFVDSVADTGFSMKENWAYIPPVYEWYAEPFESCSTNCNFEGGIVARNVVCRATKPKVAGAAPDGNHNYISWDESKCAGLTKPDTYKECPAGSCQWVNYDSDWNCMSSVTWTYQWDGLCVDGTGHGTSGYHEENHSSLTKTMCEDMCEANRECTGFAYHANGWCKLYDEPLVTWTHASNFLLYDCYKKTGSGSSVSNAVAQGVTTAAECQSFCSNYSYAAWWYDPSGTQLCRCYHVCSTGAPTSGGVWANEVYEQVASGRRKN